MNHLPAYTPERYVARFGTNRLVAIELAKKLVELQLGLYRGLGFQPDTCLGGLQARGGFQPVCPKSCHA